MQVRKRNGDNDEVGQGRKGGRKKKNTSRRIGLAHDKNKTAAQRWWKRTWKTLVSNCQLLSGRRAVNMGEGVGDSGVRYT